MRNVTVLVSPCEDDETPFSYDEEAFIEWVDEVFCEGYKLAEHETHNRYGQKRPASVSEAVAIIESHGYKVEVSDGA